MAHRVDGYSHLQIVGVKLSSKARAVDADSIMIGSGFRDGNWRTLALSPGLVVDYCNPPPFDPTSYSEVIYTSHRQLGLVPGPALLITLLLSYPRSLTLNANKLPFNRMQNNPLRINFNDVRHRIRTPSYKLQSVRRSSSKFGKNSFELRALPWQDMIPVRGMLHEGMLVVKEFEANREGGDSALHLKSSINSSLASNPTESNHGLDLGHFLTFQGDSNGNLLPQMPSSQETPAPSPPPGLTRPPLHAEGLGDPGCSHIQHYSAIFSRPIARCNGVLTEGWLGATGMRELLPKLGRVAVVPAVGFVCRQIWKAEAGYFSSLGGVELVARGWRGVFALSPNGSGLLKTSSLASSLTQRNANLALSRTASHGRVTPQKGGGAGF
ncbi:hypothetical protein L218DRAFT_1044854 [Marasmius fiardii PR-910]|nr:hypothetical protein L218DRAFT_1044854 [Marasmius fiardii PR-910]